MNHLHKFVLLFGLLLVLAAKITAQDACFSQFYANPLYLNPAFSGTLGVPRINMQYRDQWHALSNAYVTQSVSFDLPFEKLKGGIGINLIRDSQADNLLTTYQGDLMYSTILRISDRFLFSGALQAGYHQNSLDWSGLVFADNLDPYEGKNGVTAETHPGNTGFRYFDFATGIMLYSERMFAGLAVHHLAEPAQSWYDGTGNGNILQRKYTFHLGMRIPVFILDHWRKAFDLSPQMVLMQQGNYRQFNYGLLANYRGLTTGAWFRQDITFHYDALIFLVGYMKKRWQFTYSYDFTVSGLGARSGGTSEISLSFLLKDFTLQTAFPFYRPYHDYIGE